MHPRVPETITLTMRGPVARADLPGWCERVGALLTRSGAGILVCDVCDVDADAVTGDALGRLALAARRHGCELRLRYVSSELRELLDFMGLDDVLSG